MKARAWRIANGFGNIMVLVPAQKIERDRLGQVKSLEKSEWNIAKDLWAFCYLRGSPGRLHIYGVVQPNGWRITVEYSPAWLLNLDGVCGEIMHIYIKWHSYICAFVHVYEYSILHLAGSSREKERSHALRVSKWWSGCWKSCGKTGWPPFTFDEGWWNLQSWAMCQWLLPRLSRNLHALCNSAQCGFKLLLDIVGKWPKAPKLLLKPFLTKSWQELAKSFGMSLIQMGSRMKWHFGVTGLAYNMWPSMQMTQLHQWIPQWPRI